MKIDITKPVKTRDGREVEIISDKGRGGKPLHGYIVNSEIIMCWSIEGKYYLGVTSDNDLIQEPEKKTLWVNVYRGGDGLVRGFVAHRTKEDADGQAVSDRIACVKVTYIDGQFDKE